MRAAKVQKATLDPTKISGCCGRLMCCLRYEDQMYEELRKKLPKRNTRVQTEKGEAWVIDGQILTQLVLCQFDDGKREAVPMEMILEFDRPKPVMSDGRVMQTPNDRPPMMAGDGAPQRPTRGSERPTATRGGWSADAPAQARHSGTTGGGAGGRSSGAIWGGATGGDLNGGPEDALEDLLADALEGGPVMPTENGPGAAPVTDPRAANGPDEPPAPQRERAGRRRPRGASAPRIPAPRPPQNPPRPPRAHAAANPPRQNIPRSQQNPQPPFRGPRPHQQQPRGPGGRQQGGSRPAQQPGRQDVPADAIQPMRIRPLPPVPPAVPPTTPQPTPPAMSPAGFPAPPRPPHPSRRRRPPRRGRHRRRRRKPRVHNPEPGRQHHPAPLPSSPRR